MRIGDIITYLWDKYEIVEFQDKYLEDYGSYVMVKMKNIKDKDRIVYANKELLK